MYYEKFYLMYNLFRSIMEKYSIVFLGQFLIQKIYWNTSFSAVDRIESQTTVHFKLLFMWEVQKMYIIHFTCMQSEARKLSQVISYYTFKYLGTFHIHCNKTLCRIPPPWIDGAWPNGQGRGTYVPCTCWYSPLAWRNVKYQHGRSNNY